MYYIGTILRTIGGARDVPAMTGGRIHKMDPYSIGGLLHKKDPYSIGTSVHKDP